ncbi:MAG: amidohydrolase family protein, partial [Halieaceae bacterium]|nr:amidohydrolase family protein [Halieaceae bacterium]
MQIIRTLTVVVACCLAPGVLADTVITAARMVDTQRGRLVESPAVLVRGNRVVEVGTQGELAVPEGAEVINLGDVTLLPGFMDMHVHLSSAPKTVPFLEARLQSVPRRTVNAVRNARLNLMAGFTTVRDLGSSGVSVIEVRNGINAGDIEGPRIWASGPALGITGGHCDNNYFPPELKVKNDGVADGPWAVRAKVREVIKLGANTIKFCATGG